MWKYLSENRIQDPQGKVWFVRNVKETKKNFWRMGYPEVGSDENILVAVSEKWAVNPLSTEVKSRVHEYETKEVPFKTLHIKTEPFERIVNIEF